MDLVIASGIAVASLVPILRLQKDIISLENTIREMRGIPIFSPGKLLEHLKAGSSIIKNQFKESRNGEILSGKIFLQGIIDSKYPVKSVLDDRPLIYRSFFVENIFSNERSQNDIRNQSNFLNFPKKDSNYVITQSSPYMDMLDYHDFKFPSKNYLPSDLINKQQTNRALVRINKNLQANYKNALQLVAQKRHFKKLNVAENIVLVISFFFEFICSMLHLRIRGRGIKVGYQEIELGIPAKALIIIFGELIFDKVTQKMMMKKPEYFFNSKVRLVNDLQNRMANKRILMILLFVPLVLSGAYIYKQIFGIIRTLIRKQRRLKDDQLKKMTSLEIDDLTCRECKHNVRSIIFKPCHHMTHCQECYARYVASHPSQQMECPVCKILVVSTVEVFVSQSGWSATKEQYSLLFKSENNTRSPINIQFP